MRIILLLVIIPFLLTSQNSKEIFTMFYNVENFFDTINNPMTNDNEFLPNSEKKWDSKKYNRKINQLTKVFSLINNGKQPNLIGLCEVENKNVIEDLLKNPFFKNHSYTIIHNNSPDKRGIDCAILFDKNFKKLKQEFIEVKIPNANRPTRDIVYVQLEIKKEILHLFVNHWPSRWGGAEETDHKRVFAATTLRNYINKHIDKNEHIIIMGDLNDYPSNTSIKDVLLQNDLINLMESLEGKDIGSYNYRGEWNFIDHIIISNNFLNDSSNLVITNYNVFKKDWLLYENKKGIQYPNRTYGGKNWYGGFSDHLPVFSRFKIIH